MPTNMSLRDARLGVHEVLTSVAQDYNQPDFVLKYLFPLANVQSYAGQLVQFSDSIYEDVDDSRADDAPYPEIQDSYLGKPYTLSTRGYMYRIPDKRAREMEAMGIVWGRRATRNMSSRASLRHEIEAATIATDPARYAAGNVITLTPGNQFGDIGVDPDEILRSGISAVSANIGVDPNVCLISRKVWDKLANQYSKIYTSTQAPVGLISQLTPATFGEMYGFAKVGIVNAIRKNKNGTKTRIFGADIVMGYTNPDALFNPMFALRPSDSIDVETPSYGYTYVMDGHPLVWEPFRDEMRSSTIYKMDFDRQVSHTGTDDQTGLVTHGYLIKDCVA